MTPLVRVQALIQYPSHLVEPWLKPEPESVELVRFVGVREGARHDDGLVLGEHDALDGVIVRAAASRNLQILVLLRLAGKDLHGLIQVVSGLVNQFDVRLCIIKKSTIIR